MNNELSTFPAPPSHYMQFTGPTVMQPPDISTLGPTYRMFGQVVQNPTIASNANFPVAPIDKDILMYDPNKCIKDEIIRLIDTLPKSMVDLLKVIQNTPNDANRQLRDFDSRIKSLFHALEILRPLEAREIVSTMMKQEIQMRQEMNVECQQVLEETINQLGDT